MPGYDGTGPRSVGKMTGRGRGFCIAYVGSKGNSAPSYRANAGTGPEIKEEASLLREQINNLEDALTQAKRRLEALERDSGQ